MFAEWYARLGSPAVRATRQAHVHHDGCTEHWPVRRQLTRRAALARHQSLAISQRYIEVDSVATRKVVMGGEIDHFRRPTSR